MYFPLARLCVWVCVCSQDLNSDAHKYIIEWEMGKKGVFYRSATERERERERKLLGLKNGEEDNIWIFNGDKKNMLGQ